MVVHYPRSVWKDGFAEHAVTVKHTINYSPEMRVLSLPLDLVQSAAPVKYIFSLSKGPVNYYEKGGVGGLQNGRGES